MAGFTTATNRVATKICWTEKGKGKKWRVRKSC
jgi:hypothetical protein